jgi:hypothetical protein
MRTPAMNRPKAKPSSPTLQKPSEVSAGLHRLPGASNFDKPSKKTAPINKTVDTMPRSEAYERRDSGMKRVGIRLERIGILVSQDRKDDRYLHDETQ